MDIKNINLDIIEKLNNIGFNVVTSDMLSNEQIFEELKIMKKQPHWTLGSWILGSALYYSKQKSVKGIIYLTPFSCSPDSFSAKVLSHFFI